MPGGRPPLSPERSEATQAGRVWIGRTLATSQGAMRERERLRVFPNLIETFGVFWSEGLVHEDIFFKMWGGLIVTAWEGWEEPTRKLRDATNDPFAFVYFEAFAKAMRDYRDFGPRLNRRRQFRCFITTQTMLGPIVSALAACSRRRA